MDKIINYSFIIPHKNSPTYLVRCLKSIPDREDVQVIVVDDDSDPKIVNWDKFEVNRKGNFEIVKTKSGKGAGYARNVGVSKAIGKWLVFPDADDYYKDGFLSILDKYKDSDHDVVYYNFDMIEESGELFVKNKVAGYIDDFDGSRNHLDLIKFKLHSPWLKMVRRDFVLKYKIFFEEVPIGNDFFYSLQVGYFSTKPLVIKDKIYNYVHHTKSMTNRNYNKRKILTQFHLVYKSAEFYKFIHHKEWSHGIIYILYMILMSKNLKYIFNALICLVANIASIYRERFKYVNKILSMECKQSNY